MIEEIQENWYETVLFSFLMTGQQTGTYKVSRWGKSKSSKKAKKTTKEREDNANKHSEC